MRHFLSVGLFIMLAGCGDLLSVQPLATPATQIFDKSLFGQWACVDKDCKGTVLIRPTQAPKDSYDIVWIPGEADGEALRMTGQLVRVGNRAVLDLVAVKREALTIPGHFFMLVEKTPNGAAFHWLDSEWLRSKLTAANAPSHAMVGDKPVLTADSARLNAFLAEFGLDPKAKSGTMTFKRL